MGKRSKEQGDTEPTKLVINAIVQGASITGLIMAGVDPNQVDKVLTEFQS